MLNFTHIEGIVVRNWAYEGARFIRVACYPDPGRTLKRREDGKEDPEYVTLRFEPALARAVMGIREGERIRAMAGWPVVSMLSCCPITSRCLAAIRQPRKLCASSPVAAATGSGSRTF